MGISLDVGNLNFKIMAKNKEAAHRALLALCDHPELMSGGRSAADGEPAVHEQESKFFPGKLRWAEKWFSWVDMKALRESKTLEDAMREWRWNPEGDPGGNITGLEFVGEKLGDDQLFFGTLAPFIEPGSFIEFTLDMSDHYRWEFIGGKMVEKIGRLVYE